MFTKFNVTFAFRLMKPQGGGCVAWRGVSRRSDSNHVLSNSVPTSIASHRPSSLEGKSWLARLQFLSSGSTSTPRLCAGLGRGGASLGGRAQPIYRLPVAATWSLAARTGTLILPGLECSPPPSLAILRFSPRSYVPMHRLWR